MTTRTRIARWLVGCTLVLLAATAHARPISCSIVKETYEESDLVVRVTTNSLGGHDNAEFWSSDTLIQWPGEKEVEGRFTIRGVYKGTPEAPTLSTMFQVRDWDMPDFRGTPPGVEVVLFLIRDQGRFRLLQDDYGCYLLMVQGRVSDAPPLRKATSPMEPLGLRALWEDVRGSWAASRDVGALDSPYFHYQENLVRFLRDVAPSIGQRGDLVSIANDLSRSKEADYVARQAWAIRVADGDLSALDEAMRADKQNDGGYHSISDVVNALHTFEHLTISPAIVALAHSEGDFPASTVVQALVAQSEDPRVVPLLAKLLDHPSVRVRFAALYGLLLAEADDAVARDASLQLEGTTAFEADPDRFVEPWKAWWTREGKKKYADAVKALETMPPFE